MQHTDTAALDDLIAKARECVEAARYRDRNYCIPGQVFEDFADALAALEGGK
ncbi:MAG TPA: hypothetical protein VEY92_08600 [Pseudoxanthomonas sp.]|nr:hypothetical protein [Pseudoxanthomonas sp.]